jgi:hypothetical protein
MVSCVRSQAQLITTTRRKRRYDHSIENEMRSNDSSPTYVTSYDVYPKDTSISRRCAALTSPAGNLFRRHPERLLWIPATGIPANSNLTSHVTPQLVWRQRRCTHVGATSDGAESLWKVRSCGSRMAGNLASERYGGVIDRGEAHHRGWRFVEVAVVRYCARGIKV